MVDAVPLPELARAAQKGPSAVRSAVQRLGGAPIRKGDTTTFVYIGDAEAVTLVHWMDVFEPLPPLRREPESDLWWLSVRLPADSRIEYRLRVERTGRVRTILDPLNPERAKNPLGENSIVAGPGYERPAWTLPQEDSPPGRMVPVEIPPGVWEKSRQVRVHLPDIDSGGPLPLIVVHDGSEYVEFAALTTVVDNLRAQGEMPPFALALLDPVDRNREYTGDPDHARHVVDEVLPAVESVVSAGSRIVMGASLGAVASLHAAWAHPGVFDAAILQSGSFATGLGGRFRRGPVFKPVIRFLGEFHADPRPLPGRIYMSCGRFEGMLAENTTLAEALGTRSQVSFEVTPDGHDWGNWRNRMRAAFRHVLSERIPQ